MASFLASLAPQPAGQGIELNIPPQQSHYLARIESRGVAARAAEEPQQPLRLAGMADTADWADMMPHHENIMGTSSRGGVRHTRAT
jgi:hypothetical protein